jgi:hypothetical protein
MRVSTLIAIVATLALTACQESAGPTEPLPDGVGTTLMNNKGAVVHRGEIGCGVIDGTGHWFPPINFTLPCGTEAATFSRNGNSIVTVRASGVPNPTGRAVHWGPYNPGPDWAAAYENELTGPPYPCFTLGPDYDLNNPVFTVNWHETLSRSGEATLTCVYQKKFEFRCEDYGNCAQ